MTDAHWWARVVQARTDHADLLPQRVWALRKDGHEAAIDLRAVPGVGAEVVLTVDGEWRRFQNVILRCRPLHGVGGRL